MYIERCEKVPIAGVAPSRRRMIIAFDAQEGEMSGELEPQGGIQSRHCIYHKRVAALCHCLADRSTLRCGVWHADSLISSCM